MARSVSQRVAGCIWQADAASKLCRRPHFCCPAISIQGMCPSHRISSRTTSRFAMQARHPGPRVSQLYQGFAAQSQSMCLMFLPCGAGFLFECGIAFSASCDTSRNTLTFRSTLSPASKPFQALLSPSTRASAYAALAPLPRPLSSSPSSSPVQGHQTIERRHARGSPYAVLTELMGSRGGGEQEGVCS